MTDEQGLPESDVSAEFPFSLSTAEILGSNMTYVDTQPTAKGGNQPVALFIHGNPTSSYLWRNVIPHISALMRCVAPDLIGMGNSSKPPHLPYRFSDHFTFLSTFIESVIPSSPILLVVYDWGSALGLHWARLQAERSNSLSPSRVRGMVLMEFLRPFASWEDFSERESAREVFKAFRSPETGRKLLIDDNAFVERILPSGVVRKLTEAEMEYYRRPFLLPPDREPTYAWPNQIPIEQRPADVHDIAVRFHEWLLETNVPKLLLWADPGMFITENKAKWYGDNLKNTKIVHLGQGSHFLPEDHPRKIGVGIHDWLIDGSLVE